MTEIYSNFLTYFTVIKAVFVIALILMTVNVTHNALYMMAPVVKDGNDAPPLPALPSDGTTVIICVPLRDRAVPNN